MYALYKVRGTKLREFFLCAKYSHFKINFSKEKDYESFLGNINSLANRQISQYIPAGFPQQGGQGAPPEAVCPPLKTFAPP